MKKKYTILLNFYLLLTLQIGNTSIEKKEFLKDTIRTNENIDTQIIINNNDRVMNCTLAPVAATACPASWQKNVGLNAENYLPTNSPHNVTFKNLIGVNANTNWDQIYQVQKINNPFKEIAQHARSFHHAEKDYRLNKPCPNNDCSSYNTCLDYPAFYQCTPAQRKPVSDVAWNGMDLYRYRYSLWRKDFKEIHASLTIAPTGNATFDTPHTFPTGWWTTEEWGGGTASTPNYTAIHDKAMDYAMDFATKMCPNPTNCMVNVLEIGNEPWAYQEKVYEAIQRGFIDGLRCYYNSDNPADWAMKLLPAAFQAHHEENSSTINGGDKSTWKDYMGTRIPCYLAKYYEGINVHFYSFQNGKNSFNLTEIPESANSDFKYLKNAVKWANVNMPNKKVYLTEFGWDSETVGETAQGAYLIRALLMTQRLKVHRATIFNSTDDTFGGLFASAGLYKVDGNVAPTTPKPAFHALKNLLDKIENKTFISSISESSNAYAYLLGDLQNQKPDFLVVWKPSTIAKDGKDALALSNATITLPKGITLTSATRTWLDANNQLYASNINYNAAANSITLGIGATPLLIPIACNNCQLTVAEKDIDNQAFSFDIFPNPSTSHQLWLNTNLETLFDGNATYSIFNAVGKNLKTAKLNDNQLDLDLLPKGVYFIKIKHNDLGEFVKRVMLM